jgi:hypothetical protein
VIARAHQLLTSAFLFFDHHLGIDGSGADRTHIAVQGFIEIRFADLLAVRAADDERLLERFFGHEITCV